MPLPQKRHRVFVYGTLKSNHYNHRALSIAPDSKLVFDDAFIQGTMYDLGPFPAVVPKAPGQVIGEVWDVSDETLDRLDHIEGVPLFYVREKVPLLGSTVGHDVWAYFLPKDRLPKRAVPMPVGNWPIKR